MVTRYPKISHLFLFVLIFVFILLLAACGGASNQPGSQTALTAPIPPTASEPTAIPTFDLGVLYNQEYMLIGYGNPGNPSMVEEGTLITIVFKNDGTFSGSGGCNTYAGTYQVTTDRKLTIQSPLTVSQKACTVGMGQEQLYLKDLQAAESIDSTLIDRIVITYKIGTTIGKLGYKIR